MIWLWCGYDDMVMMIWLWCPITLFILVICPRRSLAKMFTAVLTHGYQPKTVLLAPITSIPKDSRRNICSGNNYRVITICSSIAKFIGIIMIIRYKDKLQTSDMQFAFKDKHSTAMCSLVVKKVIHYYIDNKWDL